MTHIDYQTLGQVPTKYIFAIFASGWEWAMQK
jgi:hypothetical protein